MEFQGNQSELTKTIIAAAIEVHREFGCGLKEEAYEAALAWELGQRGLKVERQVPCPVVYKGIVLCEHDEHPKRIDMVVEGKVVVELKAVSRDEPVFAAQCLTYLKMKKLQVGLVLNFGFPTLKEGIRHVLNDRVSVAPSLRSPVLGDSNGAGPAALNMEKTETGRHGDVSECL
ncbi:MAG: GxxExxY protein [Kiritimatiellae bacterium]|nr:GxxExxY protein [Kiritimatiellia bacterium]